VFNARAFAVARLAESLWADYLGYDALLKLGRDPRAVAHVPEVERGQKVPVGRIERAADNRALILYDYRVHLTQATEPGVEDEHARVWLGGALMTLGDALKRNGYFDHHPALEMIKHMRNAVGHGNRFDIRDPAGLQKYPAYTKRGLAHVQGDVGKDDKNAISLRRREGREGGVGKTKLPDLGDLP